MHENDFYGYYLFLLKVCKGLFATTCVRTGVQNQYYKKFNIFTLIFKIFFFNVLGDLFSFLNHGNLVCCFNKLLL